MRDFVRKECAPHMPEWEKAGEVPRSLHEKAAALGILGASYPVEVGGLGGDLFTGAVVTEELIGNGGSSGLAAALMGHGIAVPHMIASGNQDLIDRFVRPTLAGKKIGSLAITEPNTGSDVASLSTRAERNGDHYIVNGAKTFITGGCRSDFVTTAVRTGGEGHHGVSLLVIERGMPGFAVARKLDKMGWLCSDTAELSFQDVRVPVANLIGEEGTGFYQIMRNFVTERIGLAVHAYAIAQRCLDLAISWSRERKTFGKPLTHRQVIRHKLAEMARQTEVAREYTRSVSERWMKGEDMTLQAAYAKNTAVKACDFVTYEAVQIFGGTGYMRESEVERHFRDARILSIGGGATEIMNEVIAARIGL